MWLLLVCWTLAAAGVTGLGSLVLPRDDQQPHYRVFDEFWGGICICAALLQIVHSVLPVGAPIGGAIVSVGLVAGARRYSDHLRWSMSAGVCWWVVPFALWAAVASLGEPPQWDFGLYHLPAVRWAQNYPVVAGLANLHGPLGYNSTFTLLTAALDAGRWSPMECWHIAGGLFVVMLAWESAVALSRVLSGVHWTASELVRALLLPLSASLVGNWLPTLSPDLAVTVVGSVAAVRLAAALLDDSSPPRTAWVLIGLSLFGVTLKATAAAYFASVALIAAGVLHRRHLLPPRRAAILAIVVVVIGAIHVGHTIVLTGYPLYPATVLPLPVSWRVPADVVRSQVTFTYWHTRGVEHAVPARQWIATWLPDIVWSAGRFQVVLPLLIGAAALAAGAIAGSLRLTRTLGLFLLPAIAGVVFWLMTTPEPRFAGAMFWHAGIGLVLASTQASEPSRRIRLSMRFVPAAVLAVIALHVVTGSRARGLRAPWSGPTIPALPPVATVVTATGLVVRRPLLDDRCLDTALPCAPDVDPALRLRRSGDLGAGFVVSR